MFNRLWKIADDTEIIGKVGAMSGLNSQWGDVDEFVDWTDIWMVSYT